MSIVNISREQAELCLRWLSKGSQTSVSWSNPSERCSFQAKRFPNGRIELSVWQFSGGDWREVSAVMGSHLSDLDKLTNVNWI